MSARSLVVEDEIHRQNWFRYHLPRPYDVTHDVDEAIGWLLEHDYVTLWLDHDLGEGRRPGRTVSDWLIAHPTVQPGLLVRVHSVNQVSGPKIVRELVNAGRPAKLVMFTDLADRPELLSA